MNQITFTHYKGRLSKDEIEKMVSDAAKYDEDFKQVCVCACVLPIGFTTVTPFPLPPLTPSACLDGLVWFPL